MSKFIYENDNVFDFVLKTALWGNQSKTNKEKIYNFLLEIICGESKYEASYDADALYDAAIRRAYRDMLTSRLSLPKDDNVKNNLFDESASMIKREIKDNLLKSVKKQDDYNNWHHNLCDKLQNKYKKKGVVNFTVGHAQKWINMTMKYLYAFNIDISCVFDYLHVPIDSIVFKVVKKNFGYPSKFKEVFPSMEGNEFAWSKINDYTEYLKYQNDLKDCIKKAPKLNPIEWEFEVWNKRIIDII